MNYVIDFIKTIFPNPIKASIVICLTVLIIWIYKELRNNYLENNKLYQQRIEKALDYYSELELEIYKYLKGENDFFVVIEKMSKGYSLMHYGLLRQCNKIKDLNDEIQKKDLLEKIQKEVRNEIKKLKFDQTDPVILKREKDFMTIILNYIKTKIFPFVIPWIHTVYNLFFLLIVLIIFFAVVSGSSETEQILNASLIFVVGAYLIFFYTYISEGFLKKRFKHSILNWTLFLLFIILPPIFCFIGPWYRGIVLTVLMFAHGYYVGEKGMEEVND